MTSKGRLKPFMFEHMWVHNLHSFEVVKESWDIVVHGSPTNMLTRKNKHVKEALRRGIGRRLV